MSDIQSLLKTPKGIQALKNKINSLPTEQKDSKNVLKIISLISKAERDIIERKSYENNLTSKIKIIKQLEKVYPHSINFLKPKPLKRKITNDIIQDRRVSISEDRLHKAIKTYKMREIYQDKIINENNLVDLAGNNYEEISQDKKNRAKHKIFTIIGRYRACHKFQEKYLTTNLAKAPIVEINSLKLYYAENVTAELNIIASELFGMNSYPEISYEIKKKEYYATCHITQSDFIETGSGKSKSDAKYVASFNMLKKLQKLEIAYPFKLISKEEFIITQEIESNNYTKKRPEVSQLASTNNMKEKVKTLDNGDVNSKIIKTEKKRTSKPLSFNIKNEHKDTLIEKRSTQLTTNVKTFNNPSSAVEKLHNLLIHKKYKPAIFSVNKITEYPPFEFEAKCEVEELELIISVIEGSPRKAREEAAEQMIWEVNETD